MVEKLLNLIKEADSLPVRYNRSLIKKKLEAIVRLLVDENNDDGLMKFERKQIMRGQRIKAHTSLMARRVDLTSAGADRIINEFEKKIRDRGEKIKKSRQTP